jgi:queuine tRNA-ribosyltransferase
MSFFKVLYEDESSRARLGEIKTKHGIIKTPIFMPVGTVASVKAVEQRNLIADVNAEIILSNTYHLYLRPGIDILRKSKGLHNFMSWKKPILTDSGGFQVFSLSKTREIKEEGVVFKSHIDGSKHLFTPENVIDMETAIGADIIMPLDECTPFSCEREYTKMSIERTHRWLERSIVRFKNTRDESNDYQHLFGIVQGSLDKDLRRESSEFIANSDVSGFAIGGVCHTGGNTQGLYDISEYVCSLLPKDNPRYFMGVGTPLDIVKCIALGVDMFDCSMPTHCGRNGRIFTTEGVLQIKNKKWEDCFEPLDAKIGNYISQTYTKSYVHHLFKSKELLGYQIASIQNLAFYMWVIEKTRENIKNNSLQEWIKEIKDIMM